MRRLSLLLTVVKPVLLSLIVRGFPSRTTLAKSRHITSITDMEIAEATLNSDCGTTASLGADGVWPGGNSEKGGTFATPSNGTALLCATLAAVLFFVLSDETLADTSKAEAETMTLSGSSVGVRPSVEASGGQMVAFYSRGSASSSFDGAATNLTLHAKGTACQGNPYLKVYVDGALKGTVELTTTTFADYTLPLNDLSAGTHTLRVSYENDYYSLSDCDRNAFLDHYVLTLSGAPLPGGDDPVLVGAGKIAHCSSPGDEATAKLLDGIPGTVFTAGDNAYESGTQEDFNNCYEPTWGRHKARTKPSPGHHDYATPRASAYFNYFGAAAGDPNKGYYSYDLGEWHIISLNTVLCGNVSGCGTDSPMVRWLEQDLAANPTTCTLAYFNHPLFSSGRHGNQTQVRTIWDVLYAADAEVVINSRDHDYERFAPQDPSGAADPESGIREYVVGTGGAGLYSFDLGTIKPNSEARNDQTYGVLKLTLHPTSYDWQFVPVAGKTFTDSGTTSCHDTAPTIVSTAPQEKETGVALDADVEATFSEAIDPSTLSNSTFTLTKQDSAEPVEATVSYDESAKKVTLNPVSNLEGGTTYTATIKSGANGITDVEGNPLKADVIWSFLTLDTAPPDTIIDSGPTRIVNSGSATFEFSSSEDGSTFQCSLDGTIFESCASPKDYGNLADGDHTFQVVATDRAGNTDPDPASRTWKVDTTAPTIDITTPQDGITYALDWAVNADFSCADQSGSGVASCDGTVADGVAMDTTSHGAKSFTVTATDNAGNTSSVSHSYVVSDCTVVGTSGNDVLDGTPFDDVICGLGGDDTIRGLEGNDTLKGNDGQDTLLGGGGDDALDGGPGSDTVSFQYSPTGVAASLVDHTATGEGIDTLVAIENLHGSFYYDVLRGSSEDNLLWGSGTTDRIFGLGGSDKIWGGSGNDKMWGGGGDDSITGDSGDDSIMGDSGDDSLNSQDGVEGNDVLDGWEGTDACTTDPTEMSILNCEQ